MCDERTEHDLDARGLISRREIGLIAGSLGVAAVFPAGAATLPVTEREVIVRTSDGELDAYFVAPAKGRHPGVIFWPDIVGLRPAKRAMGRRLAEAGYAVIVVNQFYRSQKAPIVSGAPGKDFWDTVMPMRALLKPDAIMRDAKALVGWLDAQPGVDRKRKIGTQGYCMGGPFTVQTAAAMPSRVGAAASFHGTTMADPKDPDSPHLLLPRTKASYLVAIADNDDQKDPADKTRLRAAMDAAGRPAEIEVYRGAMHGWCPPDGRAYNPEQAERAWARLLALYGKALA